MDELLTFFPKRLDDLLSSVGKRRPWLGQVTGIPLSTINGWAARGTAPTFPDLVKILRTLDVSLEEFLAPVYDAQGINTRSPVHRQFDKLTGALSESDMREFLGAIKMWIILKNATGKHVGLRDFFE